MLYLDNAATSLPKAPGVAAVMQEFLENAANPGRSGHRLSLTVEQCIEDVRRSLAQFVGLREAKRLVFALNCTDALNLAIKGIIRGERQGNTPHVITSVVEHNSVLRPLLALRKSGAIELSIVECETSGFVCPDEIRRAIRANTKLIVLSHVSNVLGTIQDIAAVGSIARERDLLFLVDAAQSVGVLPIDFDRTAIDLLAFSGHKSLLGPPGVGVLCIGERCPKPGFADRDAAQSGAYFQAWREGGTGAGSEGFSPLQPEGYPTFFEAGTPNSVGIVGLGAALAHLREVGHPCILQHERHLVHLLREGLQTNLRVSLYGPQEMAHRVGVLSFNVEGYTATEVASILEANFDIAVRAGLHCSPYLHQRLGTYPSGTVRCSFGVFNTEEDVARVLEALARIAR